LTLHKNLVIILITKQKQKGDKMKKFTLEVELTNGRCIFREFVCKAKEQFNVAHKILDEIEEQFDVEIQNWWFVK